MLTGPVSFARYGDRHKFPPPGLFEGKTGATGAFVLNPGTPDERRLASKGLDTLAEGDLVRLVMPGAGGYGPPRMRDLDAIDRDLADAKISAQAAARDYEVVVDPATGLVDRAATARRRAG